jgi:hypothetical protein
MDIERKVERNRLARRSCFGSLASPVRWARRRVRRSFRLEPPSPRRFRLVASRLQRNRTVHPIRTSGSASAAPSAFPRYARTRVRRSRPLRPDDSPPGVAGLAANTLAGPIHCYLRCTGSTGPRRPTSRFAHTSLGSCRRKCSYPTGNSASRFHASCPVNPVSASAHTAFRLLDRWGHATWQVGSAEGFRRFAAGSVAPPGLVFRLPGDFPLAPPSRRRLPVRP